MYKDQEEHGPLNPNKESIRIIVQYSKTQYNFKIPLTTVKTKFSVNWTNPSPTFYVLRKTPKL